MQKWYSELETNQVLNTLYKHIKTNFGLEHYLETIVCESLRKNICKIRISTHYLKIETDRYGRNRLQRSKRLCQFCNLKKSRTNIILYWYVHVFMIFDKDYTRPCMFKLVQLLQLKSALLKLGNNLEKANKKRQELLMLEINPLSLSLLLSYYF